MVRPGDVVVADGDGVAVAPASTPRRWRGWCVALEVGQGGSAGARRVAGAAPGPDGGTGEAVIRGRIEKSANQGPGAGQGPGTLGDATPGGVVRDRRRHRPVQGLRPRRGAAAAEPGPHRPRHGEAEREQGDPDPPRVLEEGSGPRAPRTSIAPNSRAPAISHPPPDPWKGRDLRGERAPRPAPPSDLQPLHLATGSYRPRAADDLSESVDANSPKAKVRASGGPTGFMMTASPGPARDRRRSPDRGQVFMNRQLGSPPERGSRKSSISLRQKGVACVPRRTRP